MAVAWQDLLVRLATRIQIAGDVIGVAGSRGRKKQAEPFVQRDEQAEKLVLRLETGGGEKRGCRADHPAAKLFAMQIRWQAGHTRCLKIFIQFAPFMLQQRDRADKLEG